jgi:hypothetical protein
LGHTSVSKRAATFTLELEDGLYGLVVEPLQVDDARYAKLPKYDVTPGGDFRMGNSSPETRWRSRVIAVASSSARILANFSETYDDNLKIFCSEFLAPAAIPEAKRQYDIASDLDMSELSIRFLGCGTDRLKHTIGISKGLATPASKLSKRVPTLNFPQGRWKSGKTPRVSKGKVAHLKQANVGECVFTDTFESGDSRYAYGQAYVDYVSRYGDVLPLRSRNGVGQSLADFCCRNWVPLILIRDNIGENKGGQIMDECRQRNIKSAFICPHHPQQNFAEGYLGRVTAMASFGMVYAGAPLFMWIFAIRCAVFINNITACYYSKIQQWATPYEVVHGEPFPDTSIVVPFGCGALILNDVGVRSKFQSRCTFMIFLHYADEHPLFTYVFYSPRTKRVLHRQDCIFLTSIFPMRSARVASGLGSDGDSLVAFRSPPSMRVGSPSEYSFEDWCPSDPLPEYDDDVRGFTLASPSGNLVEDPVSIPDLPVHVPNHPAFGEPSGVAVPLPPPVSSQLPSNSSQRPLVHLVSDDVADVLSSGDELPAIDAELRRKSKRFAKVSGAPVPLVKPPRTRVNQRWFYEPVVESSSAALLTHQSAPANTASLLSVSHDSLVDVSISLDMFADEDSVFDSVPIIGDVEGSHLVGQPVTSQDALVPSVILGDGLAAVTDSSLQGGESSANSDPPNSFLALASSGRSRFTIELHFPDHELPDQTYSVSSKLLVRDFITRMSYLIDSPDPVILLVAPHWSILDHEGSVGDHTLPNTSISCPFLRKGSVVHVRTQANYYRFSQTNSVVDPISARIHIHNLTPSARLMGMSPYEAVFGSTPVSPQHNGEENGESRGVPSDCVMNSPSNLLASDPLSPSYQIGEHVFYLFIGSSDQASGLHRGNIERVILPGDPGNPVDSKEVVYLVSHIGNGSLLSIPERFVKKNKSTGIPVSPHERRELMTKFSNFTRHARRIYSRRLKQDYLSDRLTVTNNSPSDDISQLDIEDEAFDSYFAIKMDTFDKEFEEKRCNVLSTLRVGLIDPAPPDSLIDTAQVDSELVSAARARFRSLWSALQRVYFHELEDDQSGHEFSIDRDFDAASDPDVSNLFNTMQDVTLDAEIDEWFASLNGNLPSSAIEPRGGKRGVQIENRLTERIAKINRTLLQLQPMVRIVPFSSFTVSLVFPGHEIPDCSFSILHDITMETLHLQLRDLFSPPTTHVFVYLGPEWLKFNRPGSVISRFLPDGTTPCLYLQDGSTLRVHSYFSPYREHEYDAVVDEYFFDDGSDDSSSDSAPKSHPFSGDQSSSSVAPSSSSFSSQMVVSTSVTAPVLDQSTKHDGPFSALLSSGTTKSMVSVLDQSTKRDGPFSALLSSGTPKSMVSSASARSPSCVPASGFIRRCLMSFRQIRRVLSAKESLFKFGTFVPKNDREAISSPEAPRWKAGRDLEWLRLNEQDTFETDWTVQRMRNEFPSYPKSDIGHLFYVYDYKHSGEHRVRLVFDGSRQSPETYDDTYAPTVRSESVRLFHIFCVEEGFSIGQYDVPQAFLKAFMDHDIFAYPPKGQSSFNGQILKLRRALYGGKQSAYLWFNLMDSFLLELGFVSSSLDKCLYKRHDALLILFCDDLRIGASSLVLQSLHDALFAKFGITTASGTRFLGMDTVYDIKNGHLKISMETYINTTMARFSDFDLSRGIPYREIVGCLLWITLCVMGPELLRVKDLARRSNSYTASDYQDALNVLLRIEKRKHHGIVIFRSAAGHELLPSSCRAPLESSALITDDTGWVIPSEDNELRQKSLCQPLTVARLSPSSSIPLVTDYGIDDASELDIPRLVLATNVRYNLIVYGDASFAIGETKQSVSGFVVYLNGTPLLWGSLKQTIVVDSSCSAEYVAASIACKQLLHAENMIGFLGFCCPKPYRQYTDSMACLHIATNPAKLGNVRHLQIRYHLVRCYVTLGDIEMVYCVTEHMVADLFTKIVTAAQDSRLCVRFYCLYPGSESLVLLASNSSPTLCFD